MVVAANHVLDLTVHSYSVSAGSPGYLSQRNRGKTASTAFLHLLHKVVLYYRTVSTTNSRQHHAKLPP